MEMTDDDVSANMPTTHTSLCALLVLTYKAMFTQCVVFDCVSTPHPSLALATIKTNGDKIGENMQWTLMPRYDHCWCLRHLWIDNFLEVILRRFLTHQHRVKDWHRYPVLWGFPIERKQNMWSRLKAAFSPFTVRQILDWTNQKCQPNPIVALILGMSALECLKPRWLCPIYDIERSQGAIPIDMPKLHDCECERKG